MTELLTTSTEQTAGATDSTDLPRCLDFLSELSAAPDESVQLTTVGRFHCETPKQSDESIT